jgi:hypothetical protein
VDQPVGDAAAGPLGAPFGATVGGASADTPPGFYAPPHHHNREKASGRATVALCELTPGVTINQTI